MRSREPEPLTPQELEQDHKRVAQLWDRESAILVGIEQARRWRTVQTVLIPVTLLVLGSVAPLLTVEDDGPSFSLLDLIGLTSGGDLDWELGFTEGQATFAGWVVWLLLLAVLAALVVAVRLSAPPTAGWVAIGWVVASAVVLLLLLWFLAAGNVEDDASAFTPGTLCLALAAVWLGAGLVVRPADR